MMRLQFLILAVFVTAAPAMAEDRPLMRPGRDVEVDYHSTGAAPGPNGGGPGVVTMHFTGAGNRIRIDSPNGRGSVIMDADGGRMIVLMMDKHMYIERPADPNMMPMQRMSNAHLVKTGIDTVAGLSCTIYDASGGDRKGQVCLTDDGVLLRARSEDGQHELLATKVTYAAQSAALFEPPADFQKFDIPNMPGGMPPGIGPRGMQPGMMPNGAPPR
jgi:hypothetical protein